MEGDVRRVPRYRRTGQPPFSEDDYLAFVDGKPRFDGVRSFLASRDIDLPDGRRDDPPGMGSRRAPSATARTSCSPTAATARASPPTRARWRLLDQLDRPATIGRRRVVVAQRPEVLDASGLAPRFDVVVDGNVAAEQRLAGKPAPDMFLEAARRLGVAASERTVVVEDAVSGVAAGRAGGFGLVLGVDRGAGARALRAARRRCRRGRPRRAAWRRAGASREAPGRPSTSTCTATRSTRGGSSSGSTTRPTSASPRRCSPSATATSACAPTRRRAATRTATARSSTASTRRGRSSTPRRPSASPRPARRSSTCRTPR